MLDEFDSNEKFEAIILGHSGNTNKVATKGATIVRVMKFALSVEEPFKDVEMALYMSGKHTYIVLFVLGCIRLWCK